MRPDITGMASARKSGDRSDPELQRLAARFREALRDFGYDPDERGIQVQLEADWGIDQSIISRLLKGQRGLALSTIKRIAVQLGVHPGWLAFGEAPKRIRSDIETGTAVTRDEVLGIVHRALRGESVPVRGTPDVGQGSDADDDESES